MAELEVPNAKVVVSTDAIPLRVMSPKGHQDQDIDPSLPAKTTFQEDLITASQRKVNLIWEYTQAAIAIMVVFSTMLAGVLTMVNTQYQVPNVIGIAFGMITGFYFSRTNHEKIGGLGNKPIPKYEGR